MLQYTVPPDTAESSLSVFLSLYMPVSIRQVSETFTPSVDAVAMPRRRTNPGRALLRISRPESAEFMWINKGKEGSLQTAWQMARLVRQDTIRDEGLQGFAADILIRNGLDSHSDKRTAATAIFNYVQTSIQYIYDPIGDFEAIQSARQTIALGRGDCDDLSVLLATLLALVGFQPRFVLAKYKAKNSGYDHVYVDLILPSGRLALDPSSRRYGAGWESPRAIERLTYPIFAFPTGMLGDLNQLIATGAATGLSFVPVVGPILSGLVGPVMSMFSRKEQRSEEAARDEWKDDVYNGLEQVRQAVDSCQITPAQGQQAAQQIISGYYSACDKSFLKKSVAASCRNYGNQPDAFPARLDRIAKAGGNCSGVVSNSALTTANGGTQGGAIVGSNSGSLGGLSINLPTIAAVVIGGIILYKFLD